MSTLPFPQAALHHAERNRRRSFARFWTDPSALNTLPVVQADGRDRTTARGRSAQRDAARARHERDARWEARMDRIRDNAASHHPGGMR